MTHLIGGASAYPTRYIVTVTYRAIGPRTYRYTFADNAFTRRYSNYTVYDTVTDVTYNIKLKETQT